MKRHNSVKTKIRQTYYVLSLRQKQQNRRTLCYDLCQSFSNHVKKKTTKKHHNITSMSKNNKTGHEIKIDDKIKKAVKYNIIMYVNVNNSNKTIQH